MLEAIEYEQHCRALRRSRSAGRSARVPGRSPRARSIATATSAGSSTPSSATNVAPSARSGASLRAASIATRVFPTPPGPVIVSTRRRCAEARRTCTRAPAHGRSTDSAATGALSLDDRRGRVQRAFLSEDRPLKPLELVSGLDPGLLQERLAASGTRSAPRLPACPVQSDHELRPWPLSKRGASDKPL